MDVGHVLLFLGKRDALHLTSMLWLSNLSRTEKISETVEGEQDPGESDYGRNDWHNKELQVSDDDDGGSLEDGD